MFFIYLTMDCFQDNDVRKPAWRVGRGSSSYRTLRKESNLFSLSEEPIVLLRMDGNSGRRYWMQLRIFLRAFAAEDSSIKMYSLDTRTGFLYNIFVTIYFVIQYIKQLLPYIFIDINLCKSILIKK